MNIYPGYCRDWEQDHKRGEAEGEDPGGDPRLVHVRADGGGGGGGQVGFPCCIFFIFATSIFVIMEYK